MYQVVIIIGYVGRIGKVEVRGDKAYTSFRLATTRRYRDLDGHMQQATTWHTVKAWEHWAQIAASYHKGDTVFVRGYIENSTDEQGRFRSAIVAQQLLRLSSKADIQRRGTLEQIVAALSDDEITVLQELLRRRAAGEVAIPGGKRRGV